MSLRSIIKAVFTMVFCTIIFVTYTRMYVSEGTLSKSEKDVLVPVGFPSSYVSEGTLSKSEKDVLVSVGFPSSHLNYIDSFYMEFCDMIGDSQYWGSFSNFGAFCNFVSNLAYASSSNEEGDLSKLTRGLYTKVSNHSSNHIASLDVISDCLLNRTQYSTWNYDYFTAATQYGLDAIDSSNSDYWKSNSTKDPLSDAACSSSKRKALIYSYIISFNRLGCSPYESEPDTSRYSALPIDKLYFSESGDNSDKYGNFFFTDNH